MSVTRSVLAGMLRLGDCPARAGTRRPASGSRGVPDEGPELRAELAGLRADVVALRAAVEALPAGSYAVTQPSPPDDSVLEEHLATLDEALDGVADRLEALVRDIAVTTGARLDELERRLGRVEAAVGAEMARLRCEVADLASSVNTGKIAHDIAGVVEAAVTRAVRSIVEDPARRPVAAQRVEPYPIAGVGDAEPASPMGSAGR